MQNPPRLEVFNLVQGIDPTQYVDVFLRAVLAGDGAESRGWGRGRQGGGSAMKFDA